jgi:hypothetical protein
MTMKNPEARHRSEDRTSSTDCLRLEYEEYLRNQRGLSDRTIYHCWRLADRFLQEGWLLRKITLVNIDCVAGRKIEKPSVEDVTKIRRHEKRKELRDLVEVCASSVNVELHDATPLAHVDDVRETLRTGRCMVDHTDDDVIRLVAQKPQDFKTNTIVNADEDAQPTLISRCRGWAHTVWVPFAASVEVKRHWYGRRFGRVRTRVRTGAS